MRGSDDEGMVNRSRKWTMGEGETKARRRLVVMVVQCEMSFYKLKYTTFLQFI